MYFNVCQIKYAYNYKNVKIRNQQLFKNQITKIKKHIELIPRHR